MENMVSKMENMVKRRYYGAFFDYLNMEILENKGIINGLLRG